MSGKETAQRRAFLAEERLARAREMLAGVMIQLFAFEANPLSADSFLTELTLAYGSVEEARAKQVIH